MTYVAMAIGLLIVVSAYYIFTNLALAVWMPAKVDRKWIAVLEQPYVRWASPIFKWIVPIWLALSLIYLALEIFYALAQSE